MLANLLSFTSHRTYEKQAFGAKPNAPASNPLLLDPAAFSMLVDCNPRPMWIYDLKTLRFLAVNEAAVRNYMYSRREFATMTIDQLLALDKSPVSNSASATIGDLYSQTGVWRIRRKDRTEMDVEISSQQLLFKGQAARLVIANDVAGRERADRTLRETEQRYRDLFDHANDVIFTTDLEGKLTSLNNAGEAITGYTFEQAQDLNVERILGSKSLELARSMREKKLVDGGETTYEVEVARKDGRLMTLAVRTSLTYSDGKPTGIRGIARDVTERKRLEEELRQTQKMEVLGRLASGVAHDFNNLLGIVLGYCELTSGAMEAENPLRTYLDEAMKAGQRATLLTSQLLAFGRRQVLDPVVLDLNIVISNMERMLQRVLREDVELVFTPGTDLGYVKADPMQVEQVLLNLAANARDAMPNGGQLKIETSTITVDAAHPSQALKLGKYVVLTVTDSGIGMDDRTKASIFEPFFTTKPRGRGTGLGLSTVYGIVKQSGGMISVSSESEKGTQFMIYLPCVESILQTQRIPETPTQTSAGSETVLVVDDSTAFLTLVRVFLQRNGYNVLEARTCAEANQVVANFKGTIDLLLTDVIMPQVDGYQLSDHLKFQRPDMKVLYMSGCGDPDASGRFKPGARVLPKPFCKDALLQAVRQTIDEHKEDSGVIALQRVASVVAAD